MSKFRIVITEPINRKGIDHLKDEGVDVVELSPGSTQDDLLQLRNEYDALITRGGIKISRGVMDQSPKLKVIGVHGIGCDHVDLEAAREKGIIVCNTPDALTVTVAEMAIGLILSVLRNIVRADKAVRSGEWNRKYSDLIGVELSGKTVGIIGMGRIGQATAERLRALGANIIYFSRTRRREIENSFGFEWKDLNELLADSDIISLHLPGTPETHHMIGNEEFEIMKNGVILINTARGRVIDESALLEALQSGKISSAALDVFEKEPLSTENPLCNFNNVVLTPHLAASNIEGMERMALQVADCVLKSLRGEIPDNPVVI
ncbi:3-phosphoglycerate dehydrogenase [Candidatus Bathyarchaeota archaeon]|nr:3-phosphoglycerate dehydrogenase [Candidatus Bathyarchaeota archaeon]